MAMEREWRAMDGSAIYALTDNWKNYSINEKKITLIKMRKHALSHIEQQNSTFLNVKPQDQ